MAVKHMPMSSLIIGIDLDPIRAIKGCTTLVGDITTQKSRQVRCLPEPTPGPPTPPHPTPRCALPACNTCPSWEAHVHSSGC